MDLFLILFFFFFFSVDGEGSGVERLMMFGLMVSWLVDP